MKQFNLEEYLANPLKRVATRDGHSARIIATDAKGECPVVALIEDKDTNTERTYNYTVDGRLVPGLVGMTSNIDLVFATEKHEGRVNLYKNYKAKKYCPIFFSSEEEAKQNGMVCANYITTVKIEWEE